MNLFEKLETYVVTTLRFVLVAVGGLAILAMVGLLVWAAWIVIVPNTVDHREFLTAPSYAELRKELLPTPDPTSSDGNPDLSSQEEQNSQQIHSPYYDRLSRITTTLDKQYNIAGREEKKFSETVSASHLERVLIDQGLNSSFYLEEVSDDYLAALQEFATEIANDEILSRIADTSSRTTIIVDAINKFHDEYVLRLIDSYDSASSLTAKQNSSESLVIQFLVTSLAVSFTTFLMASLVLLMIRIESHLRKRNENLEVNVE